ncbi:MAG: site-2 protease family protein [Undibacterium sp.]|nr:site-2 protease family protein [Opitutaceae bacterium]
MNTGFDLAQLREGLMFYIVLIVSLCIHEWAHAFTADRLGDDTPRQDGRVTLNPVVHMDLFGSVIFPLVCIFMFPGGLLFGWGKPVRINPSNFPYRKRDEVLTTLAGPMANLTLALLAAVIGGFACRYDARALELVRLMLSLNVALAVFNLIPLPPLDGGTVLKHAIGMSEEMFYNISRWSMLVLLIAINIPPIRHLLGVVMALVSWPFAILFQMIAG